MLRRFSRRQFLSASAASVGSAGLLAVTSADEPDDDTRHVRIEVEPGEIVTLEIVGMDAPVDEPPPDEPDTPRYDEIDDLRGASTSRESITLDTSSQRITARHDAESQPGMRRGVVERVDDRAPETNTVSAFEWAY